MLEYAIVKSCREDQGALTAPSCQHCLCSFNPDAAGEVRGGHRSWKL